MHDERELDVRESMAFQQREWRAERFGLVALFVLLALAMVGLFGNGPISWSSATTDDGSVEVDFERFTRRGGSMDLVVHADERLARDGSWQVDLSRSLIDSVHVDSTNPEPESVELVPGAVRYTFAGADPTEDLTARFALTPRGLWSRAGDVRVVGGNPVTVRFFAYP